MSKKIQIAIPTDDGWIHKNTFIAFLLASNRAQEDYKLVFNMRSDKPIDSNRNAIIRDFLKSDMDFDYLWFCDSDNGPVASCNPLDLIEKDLDLVALPTPMWVPDAIKVGKHPIVWNVFEKNETLENSWTPFRGERKGLQEIDSAGSGCLIIARRVLEHPDMKVPFMRIFDEDGVVKVGSDLRFCQRVKDAGFKVWASFDHACHHFKERDLLDVQKSMMDRDIGYASRPNINTPEYWNGEWSKRPERVLPFYKTIAERVNGGHVLDFGCGRGDLLSMLGPNAVGMDHSEEAIRIVESRGLKGEVGSRLCDLNGHYREKWDAIVCTEVLEHLDDDVGKLEEFFDYTDKVIYSVPADCLPPGLEKEHRRVYSDRYIREQTPHFKSLEYVENYALVTAEKE